MTLDSQPKSPPGGDEPLVFICYARQDRERVYPQIQWLREHGVNVWFDESIPGGAVWRAQIGEAIEQATHLVCFLSSASIASEHCSREIHLALDTGKHLVPIYLEDAELSAELKVSLSRIQALKISDRDFESKLLAAIGSAAAQVKPAPRPRAKSRFRFVAVVGVFAIVCLVMVGYALRAPERATPKYAELLDRPMVAVLKIENQSGDPKWDFLSLGLMDEIIVGLQRFKSFPVVSRGAALSLSNRSAPVTQIADELNASYVMDGSLRVGEHSLIVLATLSDGSGNQVWARRFELSRDLDTLFSTVDELAAAVAGAVRDSEVQRISTSESRPEMAAWEHYMKALGAILNWQSQRYVEAAANARKAIEADPNMPEAWWALGEIEALNLMRMAPEDEGYNDKFEEVTSYFRRAHEISPFQGAACGCLGMTLAAQGRNDEALLLLEEALVANPLSSALRVDYSQVLVAMGLFDEARAMATGAAEMEPIGKDLGVTYMTRALADFGQQRYADALKNIRRAELVHSTNELVMPTAVVLLYLLGDAEGARRTYRAMRLTFPDLVLTNPYTMLLYQEIDRIIASQRAAGHMLPAAGWRDVIARVEHPVLAG